MFDTSLFDEDDGLDSLYELRDTLEKRADDYFGEGECGHTGDRGYQDILEDISCVNERIEELENLQENEQTEN